jgi:hypothetical protein
MRASHHEQDLPEAGRITRFTNPGAKTMTYTRRLWFILAAICFASFAALGLIGREIHREAPPIPAKLVTTRGEVLFTAQDIQTGRAAWQSIGGQQVGSIWAMAAIWRPTGPRTGCTARRWRWPDAGPRRCSASPTPR